MQVKLTYVIRECQILLYLNYDVAFATWIAIVTLTGVINNSCHDAYFRAKHRNTRA